MSSKKTAQTTKRWINTHTEWDIATGKILKKEGYWYDGPLALAHDPANTGLDAFQWYETDNTTSVSAQNTDPTTLDVDTTYVTGFAGTIVPTINEFSYSGDGGEINTVIAPIDEMVGDTLIVKAKFEDLEETIRIVLE